MDRVQNVQATHCHVASLIRSGGFGVFLVQSQLIEPWRVRVFGRQTSRRSNQALIAKHLLQLSLQQIHLSSIPSQSS